MVSIFSKILTKKNKKQFLKYIIVGVFSVLIDYLFFNLFSLVFNLNISKGIGFCCGAIWSYFMNKTFTFKFFRNTKLSPIFFIVVYVLGLIFNIISFDLFGSIINDIDLVFVIATSISIFWNFLGQKLVVFNNKIYD